MAKIKAHGQEIGTIEFLTNSRRYMSDGHILRNNGFGWKLYAKCKEGVTPFEAFQRAKARQVEGLAANPLIAAYQKELHSLTGLSKRWKLHAAVNLMPDDADGVWSEVCDGYGDNVHADLNDIVKLCARYRALLLAKAKVESDA